jgi:hypothetical protein
MLLRPALFVEGKDDEHTVAHLLLRREIDCHALGLRIVGENGTGAQSGVERVLSAIVLQTPRSGGEPVGFIVDIDDNLEARWEAVCGRLRQVDVPAPNSPPVGGFIGQSGKYKTTVGVWLMPDNQNPGTLEDFVATLVMEGDSLIGHAEGATDRATQLGATFPAQDALKARLHAWLAWQERPGCPFGTALRARYFRDDSQAANAFVSWFRRLFDVQDM